MRWLKTTMPAAVLSVFFANSLFAQAPSLTKAIPLPADMVWKFGTATAEITPKESMWMAGYAAREKPSDGTARPLFAKALLLEGRDGQPFVMVTTDLIGIRRNVRDRVAEKCRAQFHLPPERLLLNASHTHCGPEYRPRTGREAEGRTIKSFWRKRSSSWSAKS